MIKNRTIIRLFIVLICLFVAVLFVLPKFNIETKNDAYSYETKVFNKKKVTTVAIEVEEEVWANAIANAANEEYVEASVTIGGKRVDNVAIRTKGNLSLRSVVNSDSERYSLKIDFDYFDSTQSLYGLKKLNLNNNYSDSTLMREFISYELMEKMDLPTPAHSYMYVTVNGEDYGLFLGIEQVEETFLAREFNDTSGYLYKPDGTGSDLVWISEDLEDYTGMNLKTNKKDAEDSNLIEFLDVINNGGDLASVMDVDQMLRYFAMNTTLVSLDSYQGTMKHNYYLYESNGKYSIIPWDYNMSFGGFGVGMGGGMGGDFANMRPNNEAASADSDANASNSETDFSPFTPPNMQGGGMMSMESDLLSESSINFSISTPVSGTTLDERPLLNALLTNDEYRATYEKYLEEIATTMLTEDEIQKMTNELALILTSYVEADPTKFSTTEQFIEAVSGENSLPAFAKARSESILKQLSGELVVANTTSTTRGGQGFTPRTNRDGSTDTEGKQVTPPSNGQFDPSQMPNGGANGFMPPTNGDGSTGSTGIQVTPPSNGQLDPSQMPNMGVNGVTPPTNGDGSTDADGNRVNPPSNGQPNMGGGRGQGGMPMGPNSDQQTVQAKWSKEDLLIAGGFTAILIIATIFIFAFKRRK